MYLTPDEVVPVPGSRFDTIWKSLPATRQQAYINTASKKTDSATHQKGGMLLQTKTEIVEIDHDADTISLPNKPIISINSIAVRSKYAIPFGPATYSLPVDPVNNVSLSGDNSFQYIVTPGTLAALGYRRAYTSDRWEPFIMGDVLTINYTCGFASIQSIPEEIKEATRIFLAKAIIGPVDNPGDAASTSGRAGHTIYGHQHLLKPQESEAVALLYDHAINFSDV